MDESVVIVDVVIYYRTGHLDARRNLRKSILGLFGGLSDNDIEHPSERRIGPFHM